MTDLVGILQTQVESLGWAFSYGNKANNNLLASDTVAGNIYFLLDPIKRDKEKSEYGGIGNIVFSGQFMLMVKSNLDNVYHGQKGQTEADGKYLKNIEPLLTNLEGLEDLIDCSDYEIQTWSILDAVNVFDVNTDGLVVTFKMSVL